MLSGEHHEIVELAGSRSRWPVLLASIVYVLPSLPGVGGSSLGNLLPDARISLGLDLKGGMHLTLGVEVDKAVSNSLSLTGQELARSGFPKRGSPSCARA